MNYYTDKFTLERAYDLLSKRKINKKLKICRPIIKIEKKKYNY